MMVNSPKLCFFFGHCSSFLRNVRYIWSFFGQTIRKNFAYSTTFAQQYACGVSMLTNLTKICEFLVFATCALIETFWLVSKQKSFLRFTIFRNHAQTFKMIVATAISRKSFVIWTPSIL